MKVALVVYGMLVIFSYFYSLKSKEQVHEFTNYYFSDLIIKIFIFITSLGLIGFYQAIKDLLMEISMRILMRRVRKLLKGFHDEGKLDNKEWNRFEELFKNKNKDE